MSEQWLVNDRAGLSTRHLVDLQLFIKTELLMSANWVLFDQITP